MKNLTKFLPASMLLVSTLLACQPQRGLNQAAQSTPVPTATPIPTAADASKDASKDTQKPADKKAADGNTPDVSKDKTPSAPVTAPTTTDIVLSTSTLPTKLDEANKTATPAKLSEPTIKSITFSRTGGGQHTGIFKVGSESNTYSLSFSDKNDNPITIDSDNASVFQEIDGLFNRKIKIQSTPINAAVLTGTWTSLEIRDSSDVVTRYASPVAEDSKFRDIFKDLEKFISDHDELPSEDQTTPFTEENSCKEIQTIEGVWISSEKPNPDSTLSYLSTSTVNVSSERPASEGIIHYTGNDVTREVGCFNSRIVKNVPVAYTYNQKSCVISQSTNNFNPTFMKIINVRKTFGTKTKITIQYCENADCNTLNALIKPLELTRTGDAPSTK